MASQTRQGEGHGGQGRTIEGYINDPHGSRFAMLPDEVIWDRYFNPQDHFKGQSPLEAVRGWVQMQLDMVEFNHQLFKHGILVSSLAFFLESPVPGDIELFQERLADRYSGMENAQRPIIAPGQGSVQNLGLSNRDMEFIQGIQLAKEQVADSLGVPEELMAGAQHPTFSNREAAIKDFYANTVTQEWDLLASEMQEQFVPMLPPAYRDVIVRFDTEEIAEMQESLHRPLESGCRSGDGGQATRRGGERGGSRGHYRRVGEPRHTESL